MKTAVIAGACLALLSTSSSASEVIRIGSRTVDTGASTVSDPAFRDDQARDVYFRGWNVSGSVKLASHGFKPFLNKDDAAQAFESMKRHTGANLVRFTLSWEGTHTGPDTLDHTYVDALVEQMREAFKQRIHIFLDWHVDLFSRHVFDGSSRYTGNGAPEWIVRGAAYPKSNCGPVCFAWSQHIVFDPAVRSGYSNFFDNVPLQTKAGQRFMQDEFLWQLREVLTSVKAQLTPEEFEWITGVQPINEPIYGKGHKDRAAEFDNDKLWPFYQRVRTVMNDVGWRDKWVYAEPMVFWDTNAGFFTPATGGHYLRNKPGNGFVFAPHFYDAARMGPSNMSRVQNGEYFRNLDDVRLEGRWLGLPFMLGEYGMWLKDQNGGAKDFARIVSGTYQAMEISDIGHAALNRRPDFYTAPVAGTQWHWDIYKDSHHELQNGNTTRVKTQGDAWNDEDFSVIKGNGLTVNPAVIERAYPRAVSGNIVSFYYNDMAVDGAGKSLSWAEIRSGNTVLRDRKFALLVWQGNDTRETELFLPPGFDAGNTTVMTERSLRTPSIGTDDISLVREFPEGISGTRLLLRGGAVAGTHFALVIADNGLTAPQLAALQTSITGQLARHEHPLFLKGQMAGLNYPDETGAPEAVQLRASESHFAVMRWVTLTWKAGTAVDIWQKDRLAMAGTTSGKAVLLSLVGTKDSMRICEKGSLTRCSRTLNFD